MSCDKMNHIFVPDDAIEFESIVIAVACIIGDLSQGCPIQKIIKEINHYKKWLPQAETFSSGPIGGHDAELP
jgi:hypothetical protein